MDRERTLIYDDQCRFCTGAKEALERSGSAVRFVPYHSEEARLQLGDRYRPGRPDAAFLIEPDGDVREGAEAFMALPRGAVGRMLATLARLPGLRTLVHLGYHLLARNRYRWFGAVPAQRSTDEKERAMRRSLFIAMLLLPLAACSAPYHHGMGERGGYSEGSAERAIPEVKGIIERTVRDPAKARQVEDLLQEIVAEVQRSKQQTRGFHEQLNVLNADYNAPAEKFTKILDELNNTRMVSSAKISNLRFKIKELLTPEEWKTLTDQMAAARARYMHPS